MSQKFKGVISAVQGTLVGGYWRHTSQWYNSLKEVQNWFAPEVSKNRSQKINFKLDVETTCALPTCGVGCGIDFCFEGRYYCKACYRKLERVRSEESRRKFFGL